MTSVRFHIAVGAHGRHLPAAGRQRDAESVCDTQTRAQSSLPRQRLDSHCQGPALYCRGILLDLLNQLDLESLSRLEVRLP